jgi:hypothetical protein
MVRLNVSKKLSKLDEFHQLVMVVSRVEPLGLCLCQCHHAQLHVSLPLIELNPLLPQHLVEVEDELAVVGVSLYLLRYSYRVASALVRFSSRAVLTWARAFSEILAFSSLHASSPSLARSSSATIADSPAIAGPKDEGGSRLQGISRQIDNASSEHLNLLRRMAKTLPCRGMRPVSSSPCHHPVGRR